MCLAPGSLKASSRSGDFVILTSRELAIVIWLTIFAMWALSVKSVRSSARPLLKTLFSPKLFALFVIIISYNIAVVWGLWRVGYWNWTLLYNTVVFIVVGGIGSVSRAASEGVTYDLRFFLKTVWVNLGIMVLFALLLDFYPFSFWIEFLLVIPLFTLLGTLVVVAEYKQGAEQVHRFLTGVQAFVGLLLIGYIVWQIIWNLGQLMQAQTLFYFSLPFIMSLFFIPILFLACALFAYESAFLIVSFRDADNKSLARWKKWRLFFRFGLNLKSLQQFRRSHAIHEYRWAKSKEEGRAVLKAWPNSYHDPLTTST
jgi:uncharacterized membrane protein